MVDPMYRRIADDLRRQIEAGELAQGTQLQTELELREKYDASRNTVRDAIKWLTTRGLVETRPGRGTFVVKKLIPLMTTLTGHPETASGGEGATYLGDDSERRRIKEDTIPRVEIKPAGDEIAPELELAKGTLVVSRHQQRVIDKTPWSLQTSFYPMSFVERGARQLIEAFNIEEGTVEYIKDTLGIKQVGWRDTITVRAPDETEATFFGLPDDGRVPVIETRRTAFAEGGEPIRLTVSVYPADRNQFAVVVGRVPIEVAGAPSDAEKLQT